MHGQCLEVGVGGFLLGGGVNALGGTARHGWGAENVLAARAVLADGSRVVGTYYILYWLGSRQIEQDCNIKTSVLQLVTPATVKITRPGGAREKVRLTVRCCDVLLTTLPQVRLSHSNDLWFALRGAGSSFAVVTEFLYKGGHWYVFLVL